MIQSVCINNNYPPILIILNGLKLKICEYVDTLQEEEVRRYLIENDNGKNESKHIDYSKIDALKRKKERKLGQFYKRYIYIYID